VAGICKILEEVDDVAIEVRQHPRTRQTAPAAPP
jgi:hypothetical protein